LSVYEAKAKVASTQGMHARPATQFVQLANQFESKVEVTKDGVTVDGKSVASMLTLAAERGVTLGIRADGPDAAEAVRQLARLVATDLDAERAEPA
jgi:phosphocarrier protein HPr